MDDGGRTLWDTCCGVTGADAGAVVLGLARRWTRNLSNWKRAKMDFGGLEWTGSEGSCDKRNYHHQLHYDLLLSPGDLTPGTLHCCTSSDSGSFAPFSAPHCTHHLADDDSSGAAGSGDG